MSHIKPALVFINNKLGLPVQCKCPPPPQDFYFQLSLSLSRPHVFGNVASGGIKFWTLFEDKLFYYIDLSHRFWYLVWFRLAISFPPENDKNYCILNFGLNRTTPSSLKTFTELVLTYKELKIVVVSWTKKIIVCTVFLKDCFLLSVFERLLFVKFYWKIIVCKVFWKIIVCNVLLKDYSPDRRGLCWSRVGRAKCYRRRRNGRKTFRSPNRWNCI